jgi:hypothetical protein
MIMMDFSGFTEMLMLGFFMRGRYGTYPNGLTALELFQNRQSSLNALEHYQSVKVHDVGTESDDALTLPYQSLVNKAQNTSYKVEAGNYLAQALLQGCYPRVFIDTETGEACVVPAPVLEEVGARLDEIAKAAVLPVVTRGAEKFDLAEAALKQQYPNLYGMMNKPEINLNDSDLNKGSNLWCMAALLEAIETNVLTIGVAGGVAAKSSQRKVPLHNGGSANAYFLLVDTGLAGPCKSEYEHERYMSYWSAELSTEQNKFVDSAYMRNLVLAWVTKKLKELDVPTTGPAGPLTRGAVADAADLWLVQVQHDLLRILFPLTQELQHMQMAMSNAAYALSSRGHG